MVEHQTDILVTFASICAAYLTVFFAYGYMIKGKNDK